MNSQSQTVNSPTSADPPLKRKRGRPRKDESPVQPDPIPPTPIGDASKKNKQSAETPTAAVGNEMLGQIVTGVVEGSFDAGYLLKVKVGDDDTLLRGVVFLPGKFAPLTASNDLAPQVQMYTRTEMPIPVQSPPVSQNFEPTHEVQVEGLNQPVSSVTPLADSLPPVNTCGSSFGGGGSSTFAEQSDLLKEFEASLAKAQNSDVGAVEQPKSMALAVHTIDGSPERAVDLKPTEPDQGVEIRNLEENQCPIITKPAVTSPEPAQKPASPINPVLPELALESAEDSSKQNGKLEGHTADNAEAEITPTPLFEKEPAGSPPKSAVNGLVQQTTEPNLCDSAGDESMAEICSAPVTRLPVDLADKPESPTTGSKLVLEKSEPHHQPQLCSSSGVGEGCDSTNRIVGDQMKFV